MAYILAITLPIFLLIGLGYGSVRQGILAKADSRILGLFVLNFAMPALIFRAFSQRAFAEVIDPRYLAGYAAASLLLFAAVYSVARLIPSTSRPRAALQAMGGAMSNSGFIGYPVAAMALGAPAASAMAMCMLVENLLMLPLMLLLAEMQGGRSKGEILRETFIRLARNPLLIAITAGVAFGLSGLILPATLARTLDLLAAASAPVSLFVIGAALVGVRAKGMLAGVSLVAIAKLLVHPLLMLVAILVFPPRDPALVKAMVIFAAAPMITIYPLFGQRYGEEEFCAAALLVSTLASFFTISLWLAIAG